MSHDHEHEEAEARLAEIRKRIDAKKKELLELEEQEKLEHERRERRAKERAAHSSPIAHTTPTTTTPASNPAPITPATTTTTTTTPTTAPVVNEGELTPEEIEKKRLEEEEKREIEEATRIRREVRARAQKDTAQKQEMIERHRREEERMKAYLHANEHAEREKHNAARASLLEHERDKATEMPEKEHWEQLQHIFDEREKKEKEAAEAKAKGGQLVEPEWYKSDFAWFCEDDKKIIMEQHPNFKYGQVAEKLHSDWLHLPSEMKKLYIEKAQHDFARYSEERKYYDQHTGLLLHK